MAGQNLGWWSNHRCLILIHLLLPAPSPLRQSKSPVYPSASQPHWVHSGGRGHTFQPRLSAALPPPSPCRRCSSPTFLTPSEATPSPCCRLLGQSTRGGGGSPMLLAVARGVCGLSGSHLKAQASASTPLNGKWLIVTLEGGQEGKEEFKYNSGRTTTHVPRPASRQPTAAANGASRQKCPDPLTPSPQSQMWYPLKKKS